MKTDLALQAQLASVWRRKPKTKVMIHFDQGSQFTSREWQLFLSQHNLQVSMSRRGNCHDNAVAESFSQLLKREQIRRRTSPTRDAARQDIFEYIEMFYNPKRKHTNNGMLSPVDFEARQQKLNEAGVYETRGTSVMDVSPRGLRAFRGRPASRRQRSDMVTLAHIKERQLLQSAPSPLSTGVEKRCRLRTKGGLNEHSGRHETVTGPISGYCLCNGRQPVDLSPQNSSRFV